jgi:hypothetical protein
MNKRKVEIGKREKEIIDFLKEHPEGIWKDELKVKFSRTIGYYIIMNKRIKNLEKKGLIEIREELNKETGRKKQRVYLKTKS